MKKLLPALGFTLLLNFLTTTIIAQGKIFIYLNSHNEDNIGYLNMPGGYVNYTQSRAALVQLAQLTHSKGAKQNWGSDWVALKAIARYDTGTSLTATNGKNLCRWMSEDMGIECDPHSHETTYNYGDVAYLMSQLGVAPSGNISGFLFGQLQNGNNWEDYDDGIQGDSFPSYTWHPEVLWGGGSPNHVDDLNYYGCYKPKSMAEVNVHEPSKNLTLVGVGCHIKMDDTSTVAYNMSIIHRLVDAVENGTLPANGIYTQEIMCTESKMKNAYFLPLVSEMIDSVNVLVNQGKVQWAHLSEIEDYWKNEYDSVPFVVDCDFNSVIALPSAIEETSVSQLKAYPNPAEAMIYVEASEELFGQELSIIDLSGRSCLLTKISHSLTQLDTYNLQPGIYLLRSGSSIFKFTKQ